MNIDVKWLRVITGCDWLLHKSRPTARSRKTRISFQNCFITSILQSRDVVSAFRLCLLSQWTMSAPSLQLPPSSRITNNGGQAQKASYEPPWANTSIIGIAGSSGSGKTSLSLAIINELSLPWVVLMSMDSFYKPLTPEQSAAAFRNE